MLSELVMCRFCDRYVLQVEGWTSGIASYRLMRETWRKENSFFSGVLHFSCLRDFEHRSAFREEFLTLATADHQVITIRAEGESHALTRTGFGYGEMLFDGETCAIFRHRVSDRWLVVESDGPWHAINARQLKDISEGLPVWTLGDVERTRIPGEPGTDISKFSLDQLLDHLKVHDLYRDALNNGQLEYEFLDYYPPKNLLEYSVRGVIPLPAESMKFLRQYGQTYTPISFDDEE